MKTRMMIENPDAVLVTIKMTMPMKEWTDLRDQLANQWPSSNLSSHITDVVGQMRRIVYAKEEG